MSYRMQRRHKPAIQRPVKWHNEGLQHAVYGEQELEITQPCEWKEDGLSCTRLALIERRYANSVHMWMGLHRSSLGRNPEAKLLSDEPLPPYKYFVELPTSKAFHLIGGGYGRATFLLGDPIKHKN